MSLVSMILIALSVCFALGVFLLIADALWGGAN